MTIESSQCELSIVSGRDQLQNQTANTKKVNENEEQAMEPLLEKLRFLVKKVTKVSFLYGLKDA